VSNKTKERERDEGIMRGVWEWWNEQERDAGVDIKLEMEPNLSSSRYVVRLVARELRKPDKWVDVAAVTHTWPDAEGRTLPGLIMAMTLSLDRLLDDYMLDSHGLTRSAR